MDRFQIKFFLLIFFFIYIYSKPSKVIAQNPTPKTIFYKPENCTTNTKGKVKGIKTGLGCIPIMPEYGILPFAQWALGYTISIAGGIAFLLMLFGGFQITTSAGNPDRLQEGQQLFSSAIAGLFLIIFSVFLLKTIGITIFKIPGFN